MSYRLNQYDRKGVRKIMATSAKIEPKKYRYFCPHCTGRAMYSVAKQPFNKITCNECGKVVEYDNNNWFEITDADEYRKVNGVSL